jgi:GT2 family glycosyltransferase
MLSIIILSYRNPALLRLCLKSLAQALEPSFDYEVIVVDNATMPETRSVVLDEFKDAFKTIKLVPLTKNAGYTRGVNEGIRAAKGEYILSLNYDIVVPKGSIESLLAYYKSNPKIGLVGPELLNFDGTHQDSYFHFYTPLTILGRRIPYFPFAKRINDWFLMRDTDPTKVTEVDWISGAALLVSRDMISRIGLMDEHLFHYFSDVDWARRFWENGYAVVYYPGAKIYHYLGRTSKGRFGILDVFFNPTTRWHIKDAIIYFWKHGILKSRQSSLLQARHVPTR